MPSDPLFEDIDFLSFDDFELKEFPVLETERLRLIEIDKSQVADIYEIFKNVAVTKRYNIIPYKKKEEALEFVNINRRKLLFQSGICWGITNKDTKKVIGTIELNQKIENTHIMSIGFALNFNYWRNGYATEAIKRVSSYGIEKLDAERIQAEVMLGNPASEKALQNAGFHKEGLLKKWLYWNNEYYDMVMYGLLKVI